MINIITKEPNLDENYIRYTDIYFNLNIPSTQFEAIDEEVIKSIDNAEVLDKSIGSIRTKYGITSIVDLSSGCKVILDYLYNRRNNIKKILNVTDCGSNALELLFDIADKVNDKEDVFVLLHSNLVLTCSERDYNLDGVIKRELWL